MGNEELFGRVTDLDDRSLGELAAVVLEEQRRRARESGDLDAIIATGFAQGFDAKGRAKQPWIVAGVLVCPGSVLWRSALSHDCHFVSVESTWVWEHGDLILDEVRKLQVGGKDQQRSISVLAAVEGLELDAVSSKLRTGAHRVDTVHSYTVKDGALELTRTRTARIAEHR